MFCQQGSDFHKVRRGQFVVSAAGTQCTIVMNTCPEHFTRERIPLDWCFNIDHKILFFPITGKWKCFPKKQSDILFHFRIVLMRNCWRLKKTTMKEIF